MVKEAYVCAVCGHTSDVRQEFVEFRDPASLGRAVEKARSRGRAISEGDVRYLCLKCSQELYGEGVRGPRSVRVACPRCGEVFEVWL